MQQSLKTQNYFLPSSSKFECCKLHIHLVFVCVFNPVSGGSGGALKDAEAYRTLAKH